MRRNVINLSSLVKDKATSIVEVGCYDGKHALGLRREFPKAEMHLIDPFAPNRIPRSYQIDNRRSKWRRVERECRARFEGDARTKIHRAYSKEIVGEFPDNSQSLVFVDAGRDYETLIGYLNEWWPKVRPGGVIAGKGLAGRMRREVRRALTDKFGSKWQPTGTTIWAVRKGYEAPSPD